MLGGGGATGIPLPPGQLEVAVDHHLDELLERHPRRPAELRVGLRGIAEEEIDLGGAEVTRVDRDDALLSLALSLSPGPSPACGGGEKGEGVAD